MTTGRINQVESPLSHRQHDEHTLNIRDDDTIVRCLFTKSGQNRNTFNANKAPVLESQIDAPHP